LIRNATDDAVKNAIFDVKPKETADRLKGDADFIKLVSSNLGTVPTSAVVAFNSANCPSGWKNYTALAGRMIVGAGEGNGLTKRIMLEAGGSESKQLQVDELPPHSVTVDVPAASRSRVDRYDAGGKDYPVITLAMTPVTSNTIGAGQPFDMMPPFIVLNYCVKE
jgi:hypothetical protein